MLILNFIFSKLKVIAEAQTIITNTIICSVCGGAGHIESAEKPLTWQEREKMDTEVSFLKMNHNVCLIYN